MAYRQLQEAINTANGVENENDLNDGGYFEAGFIAARTKIVDALIVLRDSTQDAKSSEASHNNNVAVESSLQPYPESSLPPDAGVVVNETEAIEPNDLSGR